ncbi:acetyl-CoA carboxylase biotin carboxyl carrier protein subunit [Methylovirgula sp. HY1]|jgi:acetyl-CoA carboxylase biotin carboxyl carrier protein|uniref:acetyl-CoA carboxylase biotin carboxyl carrier protein n=1 Tax=Methylovirgula sp. HY1 TaxID=2822761 RepID=UPI001C5B912A|nr:acetyl-CoA carboxylase biotin carboxyl carrier protein subunit [Methylovirgula sp. HY1]QXX73972.1 Biotin carboxyl carrier protein of acetyl-CoA carboxylase [Methylovirgula sp. HY1]
MTEKKTAPGGPARTIDSHLVETLGEIATRLDLSEIEVAQGDLRIRVARQIGLQAAVPIATVATAVPAASGRAAPAPQAPTNFANHPGTVKSPMVGTAYLRPAPESPRFVELGDQVKAGDKLLLIEAMKTFNEIVAPRAGVVTAFLVEDSQPVEFGQPLVVIE